LRAARFGKAIKKDLVNPRLVFSFFTIVAALDVFGGGLCLRGLNALALPLWFFAFAFWFFLLYFSFGVLTFLNKAEANVIHGGWLIAIVGTESLVILGSQFAPRLGEHAPAMFVLIHMLWGVGLGLYAIFIALFAHRIFFFEVKPDDLSPLLWIVMGAAAISTNAGSILILEKSGLPFLDSIRPFIDGVTLLMWAWAAWLIPLLLMFDIWKHGVRREPIVYSPMLWSLVFPLGMFALASARLSLASDFTLLRDVSYVMVWIALIAWIAAAIGLVATLWGNFCVFARVPARAVIRRK
jgi:tellurite resistance protein TehA-like permease